MYHFHNHTNALDSLKKLKELDVRLDEQLRRLRQREIYPTPRHRVLLKKWISWLGILLFLIILPFFLLVRTSVYLYSSFHFNGWLALTGGVAVTVLLLLVYAATAYHRMMDRPVKNTRYLVNVISLLVLAYCCYGLLYLSGINAKNPEVRSYYHSLHPILRITLATATLADHRLVITDTRRRPNDYIAMGLPVNDRSLHYIQASGYVHAVDIRTRGRPEWKNWLTQGIFWLAGLRTNRHGGTADHLHVSLPLSE